MGEGYADQRQRGDRSRGAVAVAAVVMMALTPGVQSVVERISHTPPE